MYTFFHAFKFNYVTYTGTSLGIRFELDALWSVGIAILGISIIMARFACLASSKMDQVFNAYCDEVLTHIQNQSANVWNKQWQDKYQFTIEPMQLSAQDKLDVHILSHSATHVHDINNKLSKESESESGDANDDSQAVMLRVIKTAPKQEDNTMTHNKRRQRQRQRQRLRLRQKMQRRKGGRKEKNKKVVQSVDELDMSRLYRCVISHVSSVELALALADGNKDDADEKEKIELTRRGDIVETMEDVKEMETTRRDDKEARCGMSMRAYVTAKAEDQKKQEQEQEDTKRDNHTGKHMESVGALK